VYPLQCGGRGRIRTGSHHRDEVDIARGSAKITEGGRARQIQAIHQAGSLGIDQCQVGAHDVRHDTMNRHHTTIGSRNQLACSWPTTPNGRRAGTTVDQALDARFATQFGDLSVHEVATSKRNDRLAYLSYYAGGFRVIRGRQ